MDSQTMWAIIVAIAFLSILILVIRNTVLLYQLADGKPSPKWQQYLLFAVFGIALILLFLPLFSLPWPAIFLATGWLVFNILTVPQQVSWGKAIVYTLQLTITGLGMALVALIWITS
jgi:hypothetical protein